MDHGAEHTWRWPNRVLPGPFLARLDHPPHQVLAGELKIPFHADIHRLARMSGQRHAVFGAPLAERPIIGFLHPQRDGPQIIGPAAGRIGMVVMPQVGQVGREIVAQDAVDLLQDAGRSRHSAGDSRLVGEDGQDGAAEVLAQFGGVAIVDQMAKTGRRVGIENVAGRLQLLLRMDALLEKMKTANGSAGRADSTTAIRCPPGRSTMAARFQPGFSRNFWPGSKSTLCHMRSAWAGLCARPAPTRSRRDTCLRHTG